MKNIITYEQAVKMDQLSQYVDQYNEKVMEVVRYFMSNTAAQFFAMEMNLKALDMKRAMANKDYSNYLFEQIDVLHDEFKQNEEGLNNLKKGLIEVAKINSKNL